MGEEEHLTVGTRFPALGQLIQRLRAAGQGAVHYRYPNNQALIDVVIIANVEPWQLVALIVHRGTGQAVSIERDILMPGYRIRTHLQDQYGSVLDALGVQQHRRGQDPFQSSKFFADMIDRAPTRLDPATEADVLRVRDRQVEDADKIYYSHLMRHKGEKHASAANLAKTELAFGTDIRRWCQRHNLSTCWRKTPPPGGIRSLAEVRARILARDDVVDEP